MEQMFRWHSHAFFLEFREFSFHFLKAIKSFLKIVFELSRLFVVLLRSLAHLFFEGPSLSKWHSPNHKVQVEKFAPMQFPPKIF